LPIFHPSKGFWKNCRTARIEKGGPLTVKLPRAPGAREQRWAHLLCGPVDLETAASGSTATSRAARTAPGAGWLSA
jgi:uncharacterized protein YceH (UPF0502 family)